MVTVILVCLFVYCNTIYSPWLMGGCVPLFYSSWHMGDCVSLTSTHPDTWEIVCSLISTHPDIWEVVFPLLLLTWHIGDYAPSLLLTLTYRILCFPCFYSPWCMGGCVLLCFYLSWYIGGCVPPASTHADIWEVVFPLLLFTLICERWCVPHVYSPWYMGGCVLPHSYIPWPMGGCVSLTFTYPDIWEVVDPLFLLTLTYRRVHVPPSFISILFTRQHRCPYQYVSCMTAIYKHWINIDEPALMDPIL